MSDTKVDTAVTVPANKRRQFLGQMGLMGAGAILAACGPAVAQTPGKTKTNNDVAILNFALNLEYLEAAFYLAATGRLEELYKVDPGARGKILIDADVTNKLTGDVRDMANEIATDELKHVAFLRQALGTAAVAAPTVDVSRATFAAAANAAAGSTLSPAFDPYAADLFFLHGAFIFEDVGVSAYKGAARLIVDDSANGILEQAAGILAVEAYHSGAIRHALYQQRNADTPYGKVAGVVQLISNLRDAVDGADDKDQGIVGGAGNPSYVSTSESNIVLANENAIAFSRTPRQVANIVFLDTSGAKTMGGFFPQGLSGNFSALLSL